MIERPPGVRRLCVCVTAPQSGLLDRACRIGGSGRLYREYFAAEGMEMGFASPGVDEEALVTDMVAALRAATTEASTVNGTAHAPALAAFHVGITRMEGDDLRGAAVTQSQELIRDLASVATSDAEPSGLLVVGLSTSLFHEIGPGCGFTDGWIPLTAAKAWFCIYGTGHRSA
jgi:hypothetical protein